MKSGENKICSATGLYYSALAKWLRGKANDGPWQFNARNSLFGLDACSCSCCVSLESASTCSSSSERCTLMGWGKSSEQQTGEGTSTLGTKIGMLGGNQRYSCPYGSW